jgi:quercetin dioxygenase-like cupin family protein
MVKIKKSNIYSSKIRKINPDWFTGKVHMVEISSTIGTKGQNIYHVNFEKGSRTKIHLHDGDQILVATGGRGSLEIFSKKSGKKEQFPIRKTQSIILTAGDIVFIPRNTLHTHGSINKKRLFSHIAFNIMAPKKREYKTTWFESNFKDVVTNIIK